MTLADYIILFNYIIITICGLFIGFKHLLSAIRDERFSVFSLPSNSKRAVGGLYVSYIVCSGIYMLRHVAIHIHYIISGGERPDWASSHSYLLASLAPLATVSTIILIAMLYKIWWMRQHGTEVTFSQFVDDDV